LAAVTLAAGIFCFLLGILVVLGEAIPAFRMNILNFYNPVGPLSGKTTYPTIVFVVAWIALHFAWKDRDGMLSAPWRNWL
jgi:hypothetical protein